MEDKIIELALEWFLDELSGYDHENGQPAEVDKYGHGEVHFRQGWTCGDGCCSDTKRGTVSVKDLIDKTRYVAALGNRPSQVLTEDEIAELIERAR